MNYKFKFDICDTYLISKWWFMERNWYCVSNINRSVDVIIMNTWQLKTLMLNLIYFVRFLNQFGSSSERIISCNAFQWRVWLASKSLMVFCCLVANDLVSSSLSLNSSCLASGIVSNVHLFALSTQMYNLFHCTDHNFVLFAWCFYPYLI